MSCPGYPMRPSNGGKFHLSGDKGEGWAYELKVDGTRVVIHPDTFEMWNRHGEKLSFSGKIRGVAEQLPKLGAWLDCEVLENRGTGKQVLIVLDVCLPKKTYLQRRELFRHLPCFDGNTIDPGVYRLDSFNELKARKVWELISKKPTRVLEGLVAKKEQSLYIMGASASKTTPQWIKHRIK